MPAAGQVLDTALLFDGGPVIEMNMGCKRSSNVYKLEPSAALRDARRTNQAVERHVKLYGTVRPSIKDTYTAGLQIRALLRWILVDMHIP